MVYHESAVQHVTGQAVYIDDIPVHNQLLHGYVFTSEHARAIIKNFDLEEALKVPGVEAILSYRDIPGINQMGPVIHDELILAESEVTFVGQAIFLIAAENQQAANEAKKRIKIEYDILKPVLTIPEAKLQNTILQQTRKIERGNIVEAFAKSEHIIEGTFESGAQEHWYLETQACLCIPDEGCDIKVYSATQNPTETQILIAEALGIQFNEVEIEVKRIGGGFGGKETQGNHTAIWAAILAKHTKRPVKIKLFRDDDQKMTGKRHPFLSIYKAGFDSYGHLLALDVELNANAGAATDLSMAILERAMFHVDNAYYLPNVRIIGQAWKTNLPSNTAFRGFGGPQGIAVIENIIDKIARKLNKDSVDIRHINFYGLQGKNVTPYLQVVKNNKLHVIFDQLLQSSDYRTRKAEIDKFNEENQFYKKGIALSPVKFGISFTTSFLNQAGALVNIYTDGTVLVNHGGTEMGQGLHTKIAQIAASELGIDIGKVKVNATNTTKVPNTSPTAASSGTDLNGMAVKDAICKLKTRIANVAATIFNSENDQIQSIPENIKFLDNYVFDLQHPDRRILFKDLMPLVRMQRESLSATGFYRTPDLYYDKNTGTGTPFYYYAFGMAVTEVLLDILTGNVTLLRADILQDVGDSINQEIDRGQIAGAYIQGLGWCITEDCKWDKDGRLLTHSPDTYKIPTIYDIPNDFRINVLHGHPNANTIKRSKAIGEPPFMLGISGWLAVKYAISAIYNHQKEPNLQIPATNEHILISIKKMN